MIQAKDVAALLQAAADDIDVTTPPAEAFAQAGRHRLQRRRSVGAVAAVAAVAAIAVAVPQTIGSHETTPPPATGSSAPPVPLAGCATTVPDAALPVWARGGFSEPRPHIAFVRGRRDDIVAILFAQPLSSPPPVDYNNKVLWVSRLPQTPVTDLRIDGRLADGSVTAHRTVSGGPGPSYVNLPQPGCWHLSLHWSGHHDTLNLYYAPH